MSLNVWSPSAQPLENHRPRRQRKQQQKPHLTFVLTNLMRTRTFWSWNGKKCSSEELDQKRCSQKARSQVPTVFPAKTQKAVRSHQGKILESSKDHSEKRRSTHHKKKARCETAEAKSNEIEKFNQCSSFFGKIQTTINNGSCLCWRPTLLLKF